MHDLAYYNGNFMPINDVKISPLDRGFLFADGVYEVVPVYNKNPFFFGEHIDRLFRSLNKIKLDPCIKKDEIKRSIEELIIQTKHRHQIVYIQITRGVAYRNHAFPKSNRPTIFIMSSELLRPTEEMFAEGISAITTNDNRWKSCDIKSISLLPNVLAREEAIELDCQEAILVDNGNVTEGAASTIWIVKQGKVFCPEPCNNLLEGIRIKIIEKLCSQLEILFERRNFKVSELMNADEILLTSATKEILPITSVNGKKIGIKNLKGKPGIIFQKLRQRYTELILSN
ncbi:D-amino acid aminotransferase [Betaproteobacteria bacterium]|nr:D-amino acid aminotransferase [Betaproteobacteria bacterium]